MTVFVTGASGWIGQAVIPELIKHGHEITGLARSGASADKVRQAGATVVEGSLQDLESLRTGAATSDAVVHLAYVHDFSSEEAIVASQGIDRTAIQAIGDAIAGTGKAFIISSGTLGFKQGEVSTEDSQHERTGALADRAKASDLLFALARENDFRGMVIRFSPTVHGANDKGFITLLGDAAKRNGVAVYINDGSARWSAVHRFDAAVLVRLAVEKGRAGATYIAAAEQGIPMKEIVAAIGEKLQLPVASKTADEALPLLGFFAHAISMDNPTSSEKTRVELGWRPEQLGLLEDIRRNYF